MTQILIIEDDKTGRSLLRRMLQSAGFEVLEAENGDAGIELARSHEPNLIICDIMMPQRNGYEVLEELRETDNTASIPFIFLSAKADPDDLRAGMNLGADDYLTKPFTQQALLSAIAARLSKHAAVTQPYIEAMKQAAQSLGQFAYRDPLTNLPNRVTFYHQIHDAIQAAERSPKFLAILCLDLGGFRQVNTDYGAPGGDQILQTVARRLVQVVDNQGMVARLGGDEFGLLMPHLDDIEAVNALTQATLNALKEPYWLDGEAVQLYVSLGVALYPQDGDRAEVLLTRADIAMHIAKEAQQTVARRYTETPAAQAEVRDAYSPFLQQALANQELRLDYQPQVNLITGRIIGAEALLRWQHPEKGLISPAEFVPIAEELGLISEMGEWVLRTACAQVKTWQQVGHNPVRVSINLSTYQIRQQNLPDLITRVLEQIELEPDLLVLELSESTLLSDFDLAVDTLKKLRHLGINLAIDDFGTGDLSIRMLKQLPVGALKIDHTLIHKIDVDEDEASMIRAIIALAQSLQMRVVAEGVETEEQLTFLRKNGCYAMQGYLFSSPLSLTEFRRVLVNGKRLLSSTAAQENILSRPGKER